MSIDFGYEVLCIASMTVLAALWDRASLTALWRSI